MYILKKHPRAESLKIREKLVKAYENRILAAAGLIAHGRGECFDYILCEKTQPFAQKAEKAAVAALLTANNPVISVNGNVATLCASEVVELSNLLNAKVEVNLFYRSQRRLCAIAELLRKHGLTSILGIDTQSCVAMPTISSLRNRVDPEGLLTADTVLLSIEDGDRTIAYRKHGKKVIAIDLNPFSRTALQANITIIDNIVRAFPVMIGLAKNLRYKPKYELNEIVENFNNIKTLQETIKFINFRLMAFAQKDIFNYEYLKITAK